MNTDKILEATNGGRDIFASLFPDLAKYMDGNKRVAFRSPLREDKHPSASFCESNGVLLLHDFSDGSNKNAIEVYAAMHNCDYNTSMAELACEYNIGDEARRKPTHRNATYSERPAAEGMGDGKYIYKHDFTKCELQILSPLATMEICSMWGFFSLSHFSIVRNGKEQTFSSRADYPIFAREAKMIDAKGEVVKSVTKLYQPRFRPTKDGHNYKFSYVETDRNPDSIVNGLYEAFLAKRHEDEEVERDKHYIRKSIKGCICCGERDAVCVASAGYYPLWFNSEGHHITSYEMSLMRKFTDLLYYIPDTDQPGKEVMNRNIREYPELLVVELPAEMSKHRSDQGKPCKDLRDWFGLHPSRDEFKKLLLTAHSYKIVKYKGIKTVKPVLSADNMRFMLRMNGYYKYLSPELNAYLLVHIEGNQVEEVTEEQVRQFVVDQISGYTPSERDAVLDGSALSKNIKDLEVIDLNFTSATANSQYFFAQNATFLVNREGVYKVDGPLSCYVWKEKVIKHDIKLLPPLFTYNINEPDETIEISITDAGLDCILLEYFKRISWIYWLKLERGEELTLDEMQANSRNLSVALYNYGYLLYRHRDADKCFMPVYFEHDRIPGIELNGGTGKSIIFEYMLPAFGYVCVKIDAKNEKVLEDRFRYEEVTPHTDIVFYDECHKKFKYSSLDSDITSSIQVEQKYKGKRTVKRNCSPKIACLSNYDPTEFDSSITRRISYNPMSHFFHVKDAYGTLPDTRQPSDYFEKTLWDENYPEDDYNRDINASMQILSYTLAIKEVLKGRPEAPMEKVMQRVAEESTLGVFNQWATRYFFDNNNIDKLILKEDVFTDYNRSRQGMNMKAVATNTFTKDLKKWMINNPDYELNPDDLCNDHQTRRIKKNNKEYIYVRCKSKYEAENVTTETEGRISFDPDDNTPF